MVKTLEKMEANKKKRLLALAQDFIETRTK